MSEPVDLYTVAFLCLACDTKSWVREWGSLDTTHSIVELSVECQHIGHTHILHPNDVLTHRDTGELAILIEPPDNDQQRRDVARCKAEARNTGQRCRNDAGISGLCHWHIGTAAELQQPAISR
jgi:hypothetical protein